MVPLGMGAADWLLGREEGPHRIVAIHHALLHRRPGLWGDHPARPNTVLFVRETPDRCDVFGAGKPEPAVAWLASQRRPLNLLAPIEWEPLVRRRSGRVDRGFVQTWFRPFDPIGDVVPTETDADPELDFEPIRPRRASTAPVRRLADRDVDAFHDVAPEWALWSWANYPQMITSSAAFGVPTKTGGLASVAWIFEEGLDRDKIAVATDPRYQRLGLGRAAASALIDHVVKDRARFPIWTASTQNLASQALARSLGFVIQVTETVLRWVPR